MLACYPCYRSKNRAMHAAVDLAKTSIRIEISSGASRVYPCDSTAFLLAYFMHYHIVTKAAKMSIIHLNMTLSGASVVMMMVVVVVVVSVIVIATTRYVTAIISSCRTNFVVFI